MTSKLRAHEAMLSVLAPVAIKSHCSAMSLSLVEHVHVALSIIIGYAETDQYRPRKQSAMLLTQQNHILIITPGMSADRRESCHVNWQ